MHKVGGVRSVLLLALFAPAACSSVIYNRPVEKAADGWSIVLTEVRDGPNKYNDLTNTDFKPTSGNRFIWVDLTIANQRPGSRDFSYEACDLDTDDGVVVPVIVDRGEQFIHQQVDGPESVPIGEDVHRVLIFGYPKGQFPTRLKCGFIEFPLPRGQG